MTTFPPCPCPRPLEINEQTMTCPDGEAHIREVVRLRAEQGMLDLMTAEEERITHEIIWGTAPEAS